MFDLYNVFDKRGKIFKQIEQVIINKNITLLIFLTKFFSFN